ncbi:MAG: 7-cyano-7-deazaguanine synthase [Planctomycetes bacterium]|nr:7-cyano-7-deazaguanine synthase [Planctomycetota bacterium]
MSTSPIAVLISGGLDSAILLGDILRTGQPTQPLYIRSGLHYEDVELQYLRRYLAALKSPALRPLVELSMPVTDLYGEHWSITGRGVPGDDMPDEAVFLPGRNVLLLAKAMLWCHLNQVPAVALGSLQTNPFPDATPEFFAGFEALVNKAVGSAVKISLPFAGMKKTAVMQRGRDLPLELSFSCIQPRDGLHCGQCNKCAERKHAFADARMVDRTEYKLETRN